MAVRTIPKNYLHVTGRYSSRKSGSVQFESLLEKEFFILLDFDPAVAWFDVQPLTILVPGVPRGYTPDVLVHYVVDPATRTVPPADLCEIKHSDDFTANEEEYALKFSCAAKYCQDESWNFVKLDQTKIRTPRLENLKFLRDYRDVVPAPDDIDRVLGAMIRSGGVSNSCDLFATLANTEDEMLRWPPIIWAMVLSGRLYTDLGQKFGACVPLSLRAPLQ